MYYLGDDHRYTPEIPEPAPSLSWHGALFGGLRVFPVIKITMVRQVRMLPACTAVWTCRLGTPKTPHGARRSWTHLFCICFCMCGRQKPLSPMAHDAITRGDTGGLESAAYICGDDFNDQPPVPSRSLFWSARLVVFNDLLFAQFHYLQGEPWSGSNMNVNDSLLFVCGTFDSFSKPLTLQ